MTLARPCAWSFQEKAEFKARIDLETVRGVKTINEIAQGAQRASAVDDAMEEEDSGERECFVRYQAWPETGGRKLGLRVGLAWIGPAGADLPLTRQCELAGIPRAAADRRLEAALRHHGQPEMFNSDQGSQFTSDAFTCVLKREGVAISMDGCGRALDNIFVERLWRNVKFEDV